MAPLLEPAQTFYITYCVIYCIYSGTWQCKASVLFLSTPGPKCCSFVVCAWASGMFSAMISNTKHLLKAHATDAFLAPLTEVGGAMWDLQTTAENLFCGSTRRGWQQEHSNTRHCSTTSEMPFQTGTEPTTQAPARATQLQLPGLSTSAARGCGLCWSQSSTACSAVNL